MKHPDLGRFLEGKRKGVFVRRPYKAVKSGNAGFAAALSAMKQDRKDALRKGKKLDRLQGEAEKAFKPFSSGRRPEALREKAAADRGFLGQELARREEASLAGTDDARDTARSIVEAVRARRREALDDIEGRKSEALGELADMTPAKMESARLGIESQLKNEKSQYIAQMRMQGREPDPAELAKIDARGRHRISDTFREFAVEHEALESNLRAQYDNLASNVRMMEDKFTGLSEAQSAGIEADLARLDANTYQMAQDEARFAAQNEQQMLLVADQLQLSGAQGLAGLARDFKAILAPSGPIAALAASIASDQADLRSMGTMQALSSGSGLGSLSGGATIRVRQFRRPARYSGYGGYGTLGGPPEPESTGGDTPESTGGDTPESTGGDTPESTGGGIPYSPRWDITRSPGEID